MRSPANPLSELPDFAYQILRFGRKCMGNQSLLQFLATFATGPRPYRWMRSLRVLLLLFLTAPSLAAEPGLAARCDNLLAKWKDRLNEEHFASLVSPPFVIVGDGGEEKLRIYR